jgi:hypothetical protein
LIFRPRMATARTMPGVDSRMQVGKMSQGPKFPGISRHRPWWAHDGNRIVDSAIDSFAGLAAETTVIREE